MAVKTVIETAYPSKTYRLDTKAGRIIGYVDNQEAYIQSVYKILKTERYAHIIYGDNYGVELESLIGQDMVFVKSVLKENIKEALQQDDRFDSIDNFKIEDGKDVDGLWVSFTVNSIYGSTEVTTQI
jgi:hypothetical protein